MIKFIRKSTSFFLLIALIINLASCVRWGPSFKYERMKKQGYYPDTSDFPDTKWVCREVDMYFYMFDYSESTILGEYTVGDKKYRVVINIWLSDMSFDFYSGTNITDSTDEMGQKTGYVYCEREEAGFLATDYIYENELITCKIRNSDNNIWNYEGDSITFEKASTIAMNPISKWYCEALDMYLTKYDDVYYKGEIVADNIVNYVHAIEIGNSRYYKLSIENAKINNLKEKTVSPFVNMFFEQGENIIIATVAEECTTNRLAYEYWKTDETNFEFVEQPLYKSE